MAIFFDLILTASGGSSCVGVSHPPLLVDEGGLANLAVGGLSIGKVSRTATDSARLVVLHSAQTTISAITCSGAHIGRKHR